MIPSPSWCFLSSYVIYHTYIIHISYIIIIISAYIIITYSSQVEGGDLLPILVYIIINASFTSSWCMSDAVYQISYIAYIIIICKPGELKGDVPLTVLLSSYSTFLCYQIQYVAHHHHHHHICIYHHHMDVFI